MNWFTGIPLIGDVLKTIFGSRLERDRFQADARGAVYQQFAAEFGNNKTWWDSLIDGVNRLPRPIMTFGTIYIFWLCWSDPVTFVRGASALEVMPKEGWYILGAIVTFWFAAKLPKDFGKYKMYASTIETERKLSASQKPQNKTPQEGMDPQEGLAWGERVEKRYKADWDNLND